MKPSALQDAIVAHLRATFPRPESSRDLARRFLRIDRGDEETCRRLLAPFLLSVPGVAHREGEGWSIAVRRASPGPAPAQSRAPSDDRRPAVGPSAGPDPAGPAAPGPGTVSGGSLRDFVAIASDGQGPGGSGALRALSLLPVLSGEACQEEHLPAGAADADGLMVADSEDDSLPEDARALRGSPRRPGLDEVDLETIVETIGDLPVVCHRAGREFEPIRRACALAGIPLHAPVVSAAKLGRILLGLKANHAALDLAAALGVEARGPDDCRGRAPLVAAAYLRLVPLLEERGIDTLHALLGFQEMPPAPLDLSRYAFGPGDLRALPAAPGVYRFLDREGSVIYVGKAKNLRARLASYFIPSARGTPRGSAILDQVHSFAIERVASDLEAALLEAALIAEHRPRLNRQFEVHERPAPYGPRLNLAVILRDADVGGGPPAPCTVHLLRKGRYLGRVAGLGAAGNALTRAMRLVARAYFRAEPGARPSGDDLEEHDVDWQLVGSYLRRHRDEVSVLDLDECASSGEAAERLKALVAAVGAGAGRVVAR